MSYQATQRHGGTLNAYCLVKVTHLRRLRAYDFNQVIFWKRQNFRDRKQINGCQGFGEGGD